MNNLSYDELRTEHERVQDDMISMMKRDLSIIKKLEEENEELKRDWANLMDFTSSLTGSPCDPEDIKDYINRVNSMVTELKRDALNVAVIRRNCWVESAKQQKEIRELKKENKDMKKKLEHLPNDMDIFSWDEKREMWRHDEDEVSDEEEEEEVLTMMFEGKEYYLDTSDGDNDVYDTSLEIVGSWDGENIIFNDDEVCSTCHKQLEGDDKCSAGCPEYDAGCNQEEEEEEEDIFKAENDKYDKIEKEMRLEEKQCSCGCCDEENNKAFAKNIVQDIIDTIAL